MFLVQSSALNNTLDVRDSLSVVNSCCCFYYLKQDHFVAMEMANREAQTNKETTTSIKKETSLSLKMKRYGCIISAMVYGTGYRKKNVKS